MHRIVLVVLAALLPAQVAATCAGADLRETLAPQRLNEIAEAAEAHPYPEGNRWRAERDGRVVDILGTLHLDDPRLDAVAEQFRPAVAAADLLLVEMSPEDETALTASLAADPSQLLLPDAATLPGLMDDETRTRLSGEIRARGIPPAMGARMQPWYLSLQLAIPACATESLAAGARGLDHWITAMAAQAGVEVRSLENPGTLFALFADEPLERQVRLLRASLLPPGRGEDMFATLLESYFDERHAEAWELSRVLAVANVDLPEAEIEALYTELAEELLFERNRAWIDVIENTGDDRIVLAFGAAHLFGEDGVLALLKRAGYSLTRLDF